MWIHRLASDSDNLPLHGEFADWLDIHGDNERAEFIRLQIGCLEARRHPQDSFQADRKADDYFEVHGPTWYEPLLRTLGYEPEQYIVRATNRWQRRLEDGTTRQQLGGACIELDFSSKLDGSPTIARLTYEEGVVDRLMLCNPLASSKFQLGEALCLEPVRSVTLKIGGDDKPEHWQRQSHPRLDQIETLTICLDGPNFVHSSKVASAVIADPNLKNVRTLSMLAGGFGLEQLDRSLLQTLAASTLAQGLRSVSLNSIDFDGLEVLCENASFQWSELFLDGELAPTRQA